MQVVLQRALAGRFLDVLLCEGRRHGLDVQNLAINGEDVQLVLFREREHGNATSNTMQEEQFDSERMKRSLNRGTTSWCDSVLYLAWQSYSVSHSKCSHHDHRVELSQGRHVLEEDGDDAASLHRFDGSAKKVGGDRLEILQNQHAVGLTQNVLRVLVVAPADLGAGDEQVERVLSILIVDSAADKLLDLSHSLLLVTSK